MAYETQYTMGDLINLVASDTGGINSTNLGLLRFGTIVSGASGSGNGNMIVDRGTIISYHDKEDEWSLRIELENNRAIELNMDGSEVGNFYYKLSILENGSDYEYEGYSWPPYFGRFSWATSTQPHWFAWMSADGYSVSLMHTYTESLTGELLPSLGICLTPMIYNEGVWYPLDVPVQVSDGGTVAYCMITLQAAPDADAESISIDGMYEYFEPSAVIEIEYDDGDFTPTGGGGGSYGGRNDVITHPSLPSLGAVASGLASIYAPTSAQMQAIASWLWSNDFFDNIIKNFSDPFQNIIGLYVSPVVPGSVSSNFHIGNVDSELTANKVSANYGSRNCGSVTVPKYYNSFADYDNYRSFKIFLPYYGIVDLSTDDFVGGSINVNYNIDYFSGAATITIETNRSGAAHVLHQYATNIYTPIPFSGVNMTQFYCQQMNSAANLITAGMGNNPTGMVSGITGLISAHPTYGGSRSIGSTGGFMGIQIPYLIECRSVRDMPKQYNHQNGIPLNQLRGVGSTHGYTEFETIHLSGVHATEAERDEIERILKEGVILP